MKFIAYLLNNIKVVINLRGIVNLSEQLTKSFFAGIKKRLIYNYAYYASVTFISKMGRRRSI